jgi:hypothetical protein
MFVPPRTMTALALLQTDKSSKTPWSKDESMPRQIWAPANAQNAVEEDKSRGMSLVPTERHLLLDLVRAAEHVVNVGEVVGTREEAIGLASGGVALLEMGLLTEVAHLKESQSQVSTTIRTPCPRMLTSSYTSGATTRLDSRRLGISS